MQALIRRLFSVLQQPTQWLNIPAGGIALDVGCGPGTVTASLARAAGPGGLALGLDLSQAMLARAVRAEAGPQIGFLRADAQRLPLRDETVDAVVSIAVLQLVPDPAAALAEMARVLRADGRLAMMVPPPGGPPSFGGCCPTSGPTYSAKTTSATSSKTTGSPACGPRTSALCSGCAATAGNRQASSFMVRTPMPHSLDASDSLSFSSPTAVTYVVSREIGCHVRRPFPYRTRVDRQAVAG